jgi:hypothetical protein
MQQLQEIHGIDFSKPPQGPPPEEVFDWADQQAKGRGRGLAFASPIAADKVEKGRRFAEQAFAERKSEPTESRRRIGGTREFGMVHHTPMGAFGCVHIEGPDPVAANAAFAQSTTTFDTWFKKEAGDVFGQDFNKPLPPIEELYTWQAEKVPA